MSFKKDFIWGTATAAFQVEGAAFADGKGRSIWDDFSHTDGKIRDGSNADVACDHYHKFKDDIKLMSELGVKAYRFSISWPRILPDGVGKVNENGIAFYNSLIDELLKYGITPYITLFHWDMPTALFDMGGWDNDACVEWFAEYTKLVAERFGDRVKHYFTLNEPTAFTGVGLCGTVHAPGLGLPLSKTVKMAHNILKSHGTAVRVLRKYVKNSVVAAAPCCLPCVPATESPEDIEAARKRFFEVPLDNEENWALCCSWWCDPMMKGEYPADGLKELEKYLPDNYADDMELINQPLDFFGINIYQGHFVKDDCGKIVDLPFKYGYPHTDIDWPIVPKTMYWGPKFLYERYGLPIVITENGMACHDFVALDGGVHDGNRIDFINRYLSELKRAAEDGVDIGGYFNWTLMDNFEWQEGYTRRFGLVYVDFKTQKRIPKDSFYWYKSVIENNGENL